MSDLAELIAHLRKDADFVDRDTYDGCWEVKETDRGKRLRQAATALSALVAERDALAAEIAKLREALGATIALDDLLERRRTRENPEVRRIKMPDESVAEGPVVKLFYEVLDAIADCAERARAALAHGGEK